MKCRKRIKREIMKKRFRKYLCPTLIIAGFVIVAGAAGGIECETLSFTLGVAQMLLGVVLMFVGVELLESAKGDFE